MKKIALVFFFVMIMTSFSIYAIGVQDENIYQNTSLGIQLAFPQDWEDYYTIKEYEDAHGVGICFQGQSQTAKNYEYPSTLFMILSQPAVDAEREFLDSVTYIGTAHSIDYYSATGTGSSIYLYDILQQGQLSGTERSLVQQDLAMQKKIVQEIAQVVFSEIPKPLSITMSVIEDFVDEHYMDVHGIIEAVEPSDGNLVWRYQTPPTNISSVMSHLSDVTVTNSSVYFVADNTLYALDKQTGTLKWTGPDVGGGNCITTDQYENIYVSGLYGPNLVIFNATGNELFRETDRSYSWVSALDIHGNILTISYDSSADGSGTKTMDISCFQPRGISVLLDGEKLTFDQPPIIVDGRTLVPLRAIFEAMGATVDWDENTQTVTSTKGSTTISMTIGKKEMYKNGEPIILDVVPQLVGGRTLVPVRAVAEGFDCKVDWNEETRTVIISTKLEIAEPYKEIANYASNLCFIVEEQGGEEYFNQMLKHNDFAYDTLNELDDAIGFQETVLTLEGGALEISKMVLKFATGNYGGAAKEISGALISSGSDVIFAALKKSVPDMKSFIYNMGVTACEKQEEDIENLKLLHSKLKSGEYTEGDAVSYIYLYYQMMINNENSSLSIALLQNELPEGFLESLKESLKEAAGVFIPSISGDLLDLDLATEAMMSILEEYASFACGETNEFYEKMIENINHPAVEEWSNNVQLYTNAINEKLASIK